MPVPKKKKSYSRTRQGRAHQFLTPAGWTTCPETGEAVPPHRVSSSGWYKGKKIFLTKAEKKSASAQDSKAS